MENPEGIPMLKLADIPRLTPDWWKYLGESVCNQIRNRVQKKHQNVFQSSFQKYSKNYAKKKSAGKAKPKGYSQQSYSATPDMTLSGKMMHDLQVRAIQPDSVTIGWLGIEANKVTELNRRKNYQIVDLHGDNPLSQKETEFVLSNFEKGIDKKIKAYCAETINIGK